MNVSSESEGENATEMQNELMEGTVQRPGGLVGKRAVGAWAVSLRVGALCIGSRWGTAAEGNGEDSTASRRPGLEEE